MRRHIIDRSKKRITMAPTESKPEAPADQASSSADVQLERGTYEVIRNRLVAHAGELRERLDRLNAARREVFGSIETKLIATERITTDNNCEPRDIVAIGRRFIFGYNVQMGLKSQTNLGDVFSIYEFRDNLFQKQPLDLIGDSDFENDFKQLFKYYKKTTFVKFSIIGPHLFMVFRVGKSLTDVKTFKWLVDGNALQYVDSRSDHEYRFPPQHDFEWTRTRRESHRDGVYPHISIDDRVFVETVGGDLTIKVEDNTADGAGVHSEPVDEPDQTLDDAEIYYAILENVILLKIRPYQEKLFRYFAYNEKIQQVIRLDAIEHACVLLPEGQGLIFSNGYYLQTGESKTFDNELQDLVFERRLASPNGEDFLYVFYNRRSGVYVLLSYNMIEQRVETPIICNGFVFFENGHMSFFRADDQPQKHHALQIWQTPYVGQDFAPDAETDSFLFKIGNRDIVRGMAECHEIMGLIDKEETYVNLYVDLVKKSTDVLDSYFWLDNDETFHLNEVLAKIHTASAAAVDEFDKVVRVRRATAAEFNRVSAETQKIGSSVHSRRYEVIGDFVTSLADLRRIRGEIIALGDLRYVDQDAVDELEQDVSGQADKLAARCVEFLLRPNALTPYEKKVEQQRDQIDQITKVADAKKLEEEILAGSGELEMLIDIVSNLKIDDATQRTAIIDAISEIYSKINQARATLKKKRQELLSVEGVAEFNSQIKLLGQAVVNYLDVCDTPERCDEYQTKVMVQIEELEGRFAEFDQFVIQLSEKREEVYTAFDSRKLALVEARNKRAAALMSAADRILKGISTRVGNLKEINEIHSYFAADLMIDKVRDIVKQLAELDDNVKVDDIQSRLKTIREDAIRQLKDRKELYVEGENVIRFGKHLFSVNVQTLDLTTVLKDGEMCFHLTGTNFLEPITDEAFLATRDAWDQEVVSENREVYRAEYLAYKLLGWIQANETATAEELLALGDEELAAVVQKFMAPRYAEGYVKGVHDHDAALILRGLLQLDTNIGLLRFSSRARALASLFWTQLSDVNLKTRLVAQLSGIGTVEKVFPDSQGGKNYRAELQRLIGDYAKSSPVFDESIADRAGEYLFEELSHGDQISISQPAVGICRKFKEHLDRYKFTAHFTESIQKLEGQTESQFLLLRNWVAAFIDERYESDSEAYVDEVAAVLLDGSLETRRVLHGSGRYEIEGLIGDHHLIQQDVYRLDFNHFGERLDRFEREVVPRFESYVRLKKELVDTSREELRLSEFKPRVLTSFVRNKLIDEVYLPMVGNNLAKQIGVVGEDKRTDLMGLLLLVSPPGYGKTTLMEYIANRLGITFMKINGPAIGHQVTSLDPAEAPNASAREEIEKLNLSLEMGDNVMIYLDDIQHCNPEFLQKFISLCDGQRKIEGVYKGNTRTYDLRGRKVAVVMAGNPYTESGEKFKIPDMLANRADTYNLGDVIGGNARWFEMSYLENSLTSNPTLGVLSSRSQADVRAVIKMARTGSAEGIELEGNYSVEQLGELTSTMKKLMRIRDVLLRVNAQYIVSAAQADEFRTEPPFKLQGSYRDMNKMAEQVVPITNDDELETLISGHFENQAQTLTTGAEANLLKLKELLGKLSDKEAQRWDDIKRTFKRNVMLGAAAGDDKFGQVIAQMTTFTDGLEGIKRTIDQGMTQWGTLAGDALEQPAAQAEPVLSTAQVSEAIEHLGSFNDHLAAIKEALSSGAASAAATPQPHQLPAASRPADQKIQVVTRVPRAFLEVIRTQFDLMQTWMQPLLTLVQSGTNDAQELKQAVDETFSRYQILIKKMEETNRSAEEAD